MEKEKLSQLENAQKKLSRLQLESILNAVKKLPRYFWTMFILVLCLLGYIFKLTKSNEANAVDQMMLEAYSTIALNVAPMNLQKWIGHATDEQWVHFAKAASDRDSDQPIKVLKDIPELMKINGVAEIVNEYLKGKNETDFVIAELQNSLDLKIVGKQFYHAVANELGGQPKEKINNHLNKMFSGDHKRASRIKENWIADALNLGAFHTADGIGIRIDLAKDKQKYETFVKMTELKKNNPKAWDDFLKKNNNEELPQKGINNKKNFH